MKEAHMFHGHSIELDLRGDQQFLRYTYFIDTQYCFEGVARSLDVDSARDDALASAHRSIALLDSMNPSTARLAAPQSASMC